MIFDLILSLVFSFFHLAIVGDDMLLCGDTLEPCGEGESIGLGLQTICLQLLAPLSDPYTTDYVGYPGMLTSDFASPGMLFGII